MSSWWSKEGWGGGGCRGADDLALVCGWSTGGRKPLRNALLSFSFFMSLILSFCSLALPSITSARHKRTIKYTKTVACQCSQHSPSFKVKYLRQNFNSNNSTINPAWRNAWCHSYRVLTDGIFRYWSFNCILIVETQQVELCKTFPSQRFCALILLHKNCHVSKRHMFTAWNMSASSENMPRNEVYQHWSLYEKCTQLFAFF